MFVNNPKNVWCIRFQYVNRDVLATKFWAKEEFIGSENVSNLAYELAFKHFFYDFEFMTSESVAILSKFNFD